MKTLIILFGLLISSTGFTQGNGELRGQITDKETGEPLAFVKVPSCNYSYERSYSQFRNYAGLTMSTLILNNCKLID